MVTEADSSRPVLADLIPFRGGRIGGVFGMILPLSRDRPLREVVSRSLVLDLESRRRRGRRESDRERLT